MDMAALRLRGLLLAALGDVQVVPAYRTVGRPMQIFKVRGELHGSPPPTSPLIRLPPLRKLAVEET